MNSTLTQPIKKILVLRPDRLGDVILTLPVVRNLNKTFPEASITYLCTEYTAQILESYSLISDVIIYDRKNKRKGFKNVFNLAKEIREYNFDLAIHLLPRYPLAMATFLAGTNCSIGTGFRWFSFLYSDRLYEHRKHNRFHEAEYNLNLLKIIGLSTECASDVYSFFNFPANNNSNVNRIIESKFRNKPFILIHPGSGGSSIDWPIESFVELIRLLNSWDKYKIGITGIVTEKEFLRPLFSTGLEIVNLVGQVGLTDLALILKNSRLFISNSTGPLHLAVAMGTPVLGFFPNLPGLGPGRWGPFNRSNQEYLTPPILTNSAPTDAGNNLMENITPQMAFERIQNILKTR